MPTSRSALCAATVLRNGAATRYRDRDVRPLLVLCSGELEVPDAVSLSFFEMGAEDKMHEAKRSIFPIAVSENDRWQFE